MKEKIKIGVVHPTIDGDSEAISLSEDFLISLISNHETKVSFNNYIVVIEIEGLRRLSTDHGGYISLPFEYLITPKNLTQNIFNAVVENITNQEDLKAYINERQQKGIICGLAEKLPQELKLLLELN